MCSAFWEHYVLVKSLLSRCDVCFFFRRVWVLKTVVGERWRGEIVEFRWATVSRFFFDLGVMQLRREKGNAGTKNKK